MEKEERRENTEVLSGEEISEEQLLQRLRERSILLNLDLDKEADGDENGENILLSAKEEVIEEELLESEHFLMPMSMDNTNRPAYTGKTKKEIYDYMSVEIKSQNFKKNKSDLMDIEFSREKSKKVEKIKPKEPGERAGLQKETLKEKTKTKKIDFSKADKKRVPKAGLAENWFLMKVETELEEIMDIYHQKKIEDKWKLQL
ncbi:MAG: hypothetical protein ACQEQG_09615 [Bacillota bacterium]